MWGGRGKFPLSTCNYLSASDGTLALVLHMLNTLGGLRWIEMKKASVMITSWEAWWDGDHNKVIGLQEEHLVFCLFAVTVEVVRWERNLEVDKLLMLRIILLFNDLKLREGRMGTPACCTPRTAWDTTNHTLADLSGQRPGHRSTVQEGSVLQRGLRKEFYLLLCTIYQPTWMRPWGSKLCCRKWH